MKYPLPLMTGSKIAITAFSAGVPDKWHKRLDIVIANLKSQGFRVIEGQCLRRNKHHVSASASQRAAELMHFLCDDSIAAVVPPWGGEFAMDILPLLDYQVLQAVQPKWVMGYSDVSTLSTALLSKLDWASCHGPNLMELHPNQADTLTKHTLNWLRQGVGSEFEQTSSRHYQIEGDAMAEDSNFTFNLTEPTAWKLSGNMATQCRGRLVGGCFDTMMHLIGTEYFDLHRLSEMFKKDGLIIYLENVEMSPTSYKRALQSLKYKGVFERCNGVLIGRSAARNLSDHGLSTNDVLTEVTQDLAIPVIYDMDIGHLPPNLTLINGALAQVNVMGHSGRIHQRLC
ncbi:S66 family peptidase [Vibrio ostreicida]|uniref:LD-carboxypeptidase n=1 Tax=Vibrio ostreicida TaxID=526588 RepID=A0ABT8BTU2_9VIBR|nr:S66 peptidase family protein [Vibrio ostreicida]MDN3610411.1 LD-carboxypeptidase [Vibrio ostreicida]NPD07579.1 LD-carboxypeptidase [Vibrio ostreicida]